MATGRAFTDLIGCRLPIQLASLGGPVGTPELAAAVSDAGGLGMVPNPTSATEVERLVTSARELTSQPIGIGFLVPFVAEEAVKAAAAMANVVEFFYGDPARDLVRLGNAHGTLVGWQTGSAAEAVAAMEAGCDYVVVQGTEAGGHVRGTERLDRVLEDALNRVDVPVVAAGGIGTSKRAAAVLAAGASAVRVGTRFVAAEESNAHPEYVASLIAASADDTILTDAFGANWPDAPHRVLRTAVQAAERVEGAAVAIADGREIPRFHSMPPTRQVRGEIAAMALYAGESVDAVTAVQPASEIVSELTADLPRRTS
jgi:nitronate monooxygenase